MGEEHAEHGREELGGEKRERPGERRGGCEEEKRYRCALFLASVLWQKREEGELGGAYDAARHVRGVGEEGSECSGSEEREKRPHHCECEREQLWGITQPPQRRAPPEKMAEKPWYSLRLRG